MALVLSTNCGFVTAAPTENPDGTQTTIGGRSYAFKVTAPVGATGITEIGWYCESANPEENFEVGLYSHDSENNLPSTRLFVDNTNAKGTTAGWKSVVVDWEITAGTVYWLAIEIDYTEGPTYFDVTENAGELSSYKFSQSTLLDPWQSDGTSTVLSAIYAVYEGAEEGTVGAMTLNTGFWGP